MTDVTGQAQKAEIGMINSVFHCHDSNVASSHQVVHACSHPTLILVRPIHFDTGIPSIHLPCQHLKLTVIFNSPISSMIVVVYCSTDYQLSHNSLGQSTYFGRTLQSQQVLLLILVPSHCCVCPLHTIYELNHQVLMHLMQL